MDKYNNNLSYVVTDSKKKKNFLEKTTHVFFNENDNRYVENKLHNFNKSLPQNPDCFKKSILDKMKFSTTKSFKLSGFPTKGNSNLSLNKMNETIKNNKNNNQRSKFCLTQKKQLKGNFTKFFNKDNENFNRTKEKLQFISMHDSAKSIFESEKPNKNITIDFLSSPKASPVNHKFVHKAKSLNYFTQVQKNLLKFREKLFNRGGKTIFSLSKQFKIFDSNNDKIISFSEFLNAIKIYKIDLSFKESDELFKYFDKDKKGYINYEEFLGNLIEDMNERRYNLVLNIFNQIDKEKKGFIDLDTIKFLYDAKSHPGVISKKKKEDQILNEFLQTFELHHKNFKSTEKNIQLSKTLVSKRKEKSISLNEFIAYYNSISISIESDDYFEEILNNSWRLKKSFQDQLNQSAWVKEFNLKKIVSSPIMIQNHNLELCSPDVFQLKRREYYKLLKKKSSFRLDPWEANSDHGINYDGKTEKIIPRKKPISVEVVDYSRRNSNREDVFIKFKNKLLSRGIREISSISKLFKISDKNKNFKIEFNEFNRICKEYNIGLEDDEIRYLFNKFDIDGSGDISFDEFLKCFIGGMNQFRINLIKKIFEKIDANHNGIIDIDDIKSIFNGKMHPDVKSGKIMEEQALEQFLKVFDINSNKVIKFNFRKIMK